MTTLISECINKSISERNNLVIEHRYLVPFIVSRLTIKLPNSLDKADVISTGTWGLLEAANRYQAHKNILFKHFAIRRIKGAIYDLLRAQSFGGQRICKMSKTIQKAIASIEEKSLKPATDAQIANYLSISIKELNARYTEINLSYLVHIDEQDSEESYIRHVGSSDRVGLEDAYEYQTVKQTLAQHIRALPKNEQLVLSLYYYQELTLKEISYILSLSESRISQIHSKALLKLRSRLSD